MAASNPACSHRSYPAAADATPGWRRSPQTPRSPQRARASGRRSSLSGFSRTTRATLVYATSTPPCATRTTSASRAPAVVVPPGRSRSVSQTCTATSACAVVKRCWSSSTTPLTPLRALVGARQSRRWRLVCWPARANDRFAIATAGDQAILPLAPERTRRANTDIASRLRDRAEELDGSSLCVAGVELWPLVREPLFEMLERYGQYAASLVGQVDSELDRHHVRAVLVPFDSPPHARLVVRVSQARGIPTFVIGDGFKADEIQQEGMAADVALAWSTAMRDCYYSRRPSPAVVTGNPRMERRMQLSARRSERRRVLVGGTLSRRSTSTVVGRTLSGSLQRSSTASRRRDGMSPTKSSSSSTRQIRRRTIEQ